MLSFRTGLPQYPQSLHKAQNSRKALDRAMMGITITQQLSNSATQQLSNSATQQLDCALINGRFFHLSNTIIIFSHQLLQTANVLLVFLSLHTDGTLLPWAYFVR